MDRRVKERLVGATILVGLIVLIVPELLSGPPGPAPAPMGPRLPVRTSEPVRNVTVDLATSKAPTPAPAAAEAAASSAEPLEARSTDVSSAAADVGASAGTGANAAAPSGMSPVDSPATDTPAVVPSRPAAPSAAAPPAVTTPPATPPRSGSSASLESATPAPTLTLPGKQAKPRMAGRAWAVQLGSFASHANADKLVRQLKAQGFSVYVVPGGSGPHLRYRVRIGPMADRGAATQAIAKLKAVGQSASLVPLAP